MEGREATLINHYKGYRNIMLVRYWADIYQWEVEICGSGKHLFVYDDEFVID